MIFTAGSSDKMSKAFTVSYDKEGNLIYFHKSTFPHLEVKCSIQAKAETLIINEFRKQICQEHK
jgi:hypothetical protein